MGQIRLLADLGAGGLGVLGWIITGSAVQTTAIALIYSAIQIPAFYLHERWW